MFLSGLENELDEIKRYLSDEYIYRFLLMQVISVVHMVLAGLAFKNDIG
jgi:hypothetical protein